MSDKEENDLAFMRKMLEEHPEWANWTIDDLRAEQCRLIAEAEDLDERRARVYRENGFVAPSDSALFLDLFSGRSEDSTFEELIGYLRLKKKRGHKQQKALDIWDAHYSRKAFMPDPEAIERLEQIFWSREQKKAAK